MRDDGGPVFIQHIVRPWETALFRRCRRAWDLGARSRQAYQPMVPAHVADLDEAVHDALNVYYFPGMWDWNRVIVRPLAVQAFVRSMHRQRDAFAAHREPSQTEQEHWQRQFDLGRALLERYFGWAAAVDRFSSVQVAALFDVTIPDPDNPEVGLCTADGQGVWYRIRIDQVIVDEHERCWLVEHRLVEGGWPELDLLLLDEPSLTRSWAWQVGFLGRIEGTIYNELRFPTTTDQRETDPVEVRALAGPDGLIKQEVGTLFRRTHVPRAPEQLERRGRNVGLEVSEMIDPALRLYPNPSVEHCGDCVYRTPCLAMCHGEDPDPILRGGYRRRTEEDFEPGRLGSVWGFVPEVHRVREHKPPAG